MEFTTEPVFAPPHARNARPLAVFAPTDPDGHLSAVAEVNAAPRRLGAIVIGGEGEIVARLECSGEGTVPVRLADLLSAFARGQARLCAPEGHTGWVKAQALYGMPGGRGHDVDIYRTRQEPTWCHVAIRPSARRGGLNLYTADDVLAERVARLAESGLMEVLAPAPQAGQAIY